jgi:hypothetical protein
MELPSASKNGFVVYKLYVKTSPSKAGKIAGSINVFDKTETYKIALSGDCLQVNDNQKVMVSYQLSANDKAEAQGNVSALNETWTGMELKGYQTPETININGGKLAQTSLQIDNIQGGVWPKGELDVVYTRYVQFGVKVAKGTELFVDSIGFYAGGGAKFRVVSSLTEDFSNAVTLGESKESSGSALVGNSFNPNQLVQSGKTLYIRIYPWCKDASKEQVLMLGGLTIRGIAK